MSREINCKMSKRAGVGYDSLCKGIIVVFSMFYK